MRFKRIYVEISDFCNLDCSFCTNKKNTRMMSLENFNKVISNIEGYTKEICLHVLGEPLVHPNFLKILDSASKKFDVMITTNGFLLHKFMMVEAIKFRKMNISLNSSYNLDLEETKKYLDNIFSFIEFAKRINPEVVFNLRMWAFDKTEVNKHAKFIYDYIKNKYNIDISSIDGNLRLEKKVILTFDKEFKWPSENNEIIGDVGTCKGGKTHIAILADGRVSICCLDSCASSNLGNIFNEKLSDILNSKKFKEIISGFNQNKLYLDICKRCSFHKRRDD